MYIVLKNIRHGLKPIPFQSLRTVKLQKENMNEIVNLNPPDSVRGMLELSEECFKKNVSIPVLHVKDVKLSNIIKLVKPELLKVENFKPIKSDESGTQIYLNPNRVDSENLENELNKFGLGKKDIILTNFTLNYENFSAEQVFRAVLPKNKEGMASFTKIGHILHVNLREHLLPFKKLIGKVLFDKIPGCKTVVNKTNMIDNTYRNFQMEILEGEDDMMVTLKENKCTFQFDFSAVYWNSRLSSEHECIVKKLNSNDVLFDVCAGVGPFSVPLAKKSCIVHANDLNPESYKWMNHNFKLNKIKTDCFKTYNKDAKMFILEEIKEYLPKYLTTHKDY
ncbi:unnamed protein product [Brassicogethes aeneus]|uniref:SAM-dependent methyltransferase TRM5/TYW2-type domain-containing protein n=1 Tax=Brassicogethes aeneus TaxID=1431903 RepID=A0A9P0B351_BRAAE|nr:unnamed protein product [Brassicogethes aeneus]